MSELALPGLTGPGIAALAASWADGGLWNDIQLLADRFFDASEAEKPFRWHHLVMAVGNFKRQGNRRLRPNLLALPPHSSEHPTRPSTFVVPSGGTLAEEDPASWAALMHGLTGAAVPTTTTLLAALWPDSHFVYDWRVHQAANGLRAAASLPTTADVTAAGSTAGMNTLDHYGIVRGWLLQAASDSGESLPDVERALYRLSQKVKSVPGRTWTDYGARLAEAAADALSVAAPAQLQ